MSNRYEPIRFSVPGRDNAGNPKRKLGKGLDALMKETRREEPLDRRDDPAGGGEGKAQDDKAGALRLIPVAAIKPLPGQPRTVFNEEALEQLAASIKARGLIQPILVQPQADGSYRIVAGERRWRAAQKAQLKEVPAIVRELDQREVMALALIENLQREDLSPVEEARAYHRLSEQEGMIQIDIGWLICVLNFLFHKSFFFSASRQHQKS